MTETHKIFDGEYYHNQTEFVEIEKQNLIYIHTERDHRQKVFMHLVLGFVIL